MSNNVTRKGLAFGALVALTSTAFAGAPAFAAGEVLLAPSAGTSYTVSTTDTFTLNASLAPGQVAGNISQLKYRVVTDGSFIAKATVTSGGNAAFDVFTNATGVATSAANKGATGVGATNYVAANVQTAKVIAPATNTTTVNTIAVSVDSTSNATTATTGDAASATTPTETVAVTAWIDSNNDNAVTAGEFFETRTITFKKYSEIVPTVAIDAPSTGDTSLSATVTWGDLNLDQVSGEGLTFDYTDSVSAKTAQAATLANGKWTKGSIAGTGLVSASTVTAKALIGATQVGTSATATVTARTIATVTGEFVASDDAKTISSTNFVRLNKAFSVKAVVKDNASTPKGVAGVAVVAKVSTSATLSGTAGSVKSVTVNGTTYTSGSSDFATVNLTSDADGYVTLNISSAGLADANTITAAFTAQNLSASVVTTQEGDLTYAVTDASAAPIVATNKNTGVELTYNVKDQFGVASAATNQRIAVTATNATSGSTQFVPVAAGVAKFTVTPATDSTADVVVTSTLDTSAVASNQNLTWTTGASTGITNTLKVRAAAFTFTTAPAVDANNGINNGAAVTNSVANSQRITQLDLAGLNAAAPNAVAVAAGDVYAMLTFAGSVAGEKITVSGTDVYIAWAGGTASANTATKIVQATSNTVYVAANTVGTKTITFTNGTETKTVDVKFASTTGTTVRATAANFAVAVAAAAQAGRSIDATVTVTDKWGNPVAGFEATASVAGVASVNGGFSANVTTDANGKATVKLTAGINDLGDAVVTFSDNDTNTSTNVTAVAKTVVFGQTDGYIDILNGKRASVTWSMAKGKRVAFLLNGVRKYNFVQTGDAELNLQFNLRKGTHNIKLIIGGVIVDDITVKITK